MKRSRTSLMAFVVLVSISFSGCMSGSVGVRANAEASGGDSPGAPGGISSSHGSSSSGSPTAFAGASNVFFASMDGDTGYLTGLGFLSQQASPDANPFEFQIKGASSAAVSVRYWKPVLVSGREEVAWIQRSQANGDLLLAINDPASMQVRNIGKVLPARSYDLYGDATSPALAGVDANGALFVQRMESTVNGMGGFHAGSTVQWLGDQGATRLAVLDPVTATVSLFSSDDLKHPVSTQAASAFSASPSGRTYLVFSAAAGHLSAVDSSTGKTRVLSARVSGFDQASWNGENTVAFASADASGVSVSVLDVPGGVISARYSVTPVSGAGSDADVCPSWVGGNLFFASMDDAAEAPAIWKTDGRTSGSAQEFAASLDSGHQFVCPRGVTP